MLLLPEIPLPAGSPCHAPWPPVLTSLSSDSSEEDKRGDCSSMAGGKQLLCPPVTVSCPGSCGQFPHLPACFSPFLSSDLGAPCPSSWHRGELSNLPCLLRCWGISLLPRPGCGELVNHWGCFFIFWGHFLWSLAGAFFVLLILIIHLYYSSAWDPPLWTRTPVC